ncbi:MAG: undecaprenyl-diphosphate phosphatase [Actinomycetes bacterium]
MHHALLAASQPNHLSYFQAIVIGILQGVTELFPVSSLGHSVILPKLFGWDNIVVQQSESESGYLAFLVGLHCGTALALIVFYFQDWKDIIAGLWTSTKTRKIETSTQRLGWLLIVGTIPVAIVGLALEHKLRTTFSKPVYASVFLFFNGFVLLLAERVRKSQLKGTHRRRNTVAPELATLPMKDGLIVGASQILALLPGFSRSGVSMAAGLLRGLNHEDAAKFTFLLATPIILAAGVYKLPDLTGPNGKGILGQVIVGSIAAGIAAYIAIRWLSKYFETKTLLPFGIYCLAAGAGCTVYFGFFN